MFGYYQLYAALLGFFGVFAFVQKRSVMSLVGSIFISLIYLAASNYKSKNDVKGNYLAFFGAFLLVSIGLMRYVKSSKFMPGGVLLILGLISIVLEVLGK
eukprot:gene3619-6435_t